MANAPLPREDLPRVGQGGFQVLATLVIVITGLYFGREIFVPLALSVLLSFALAPLVSWLRRWYVPRIPAVVSVVLLAFVAISAFGTVVAGQLTQLAGNLPTYQANLQAKIRFLRDAGAGGQAVERASEMLRELGTELSSEAPPNASTRTPSGSARTPAQPIPVQIQQPDPAPLQLLQNVVGPLLGPLATSAVVVVFVIFILLQREDLRDRFIRLAGSSDLTRTTEALVDAGKRVARYLFMQLVVNVTYGIPVGIGLWFIGVPNPVLWGFLAMVLRFVPYVGPVIAAIFPIALALAVDPGWSMVLWTVALLIVIELISNNIVEPWLYGSSTGLSPVAIIVAAIFWTWLWGPIGLLLSTPLTVCLVVLGRHVRQFEFLDVLLGSEPVLTAPESLYQRLLADDPFEATERAEEYLEVRPLAAFYDEVAIPALGLMEHDRAGGRLNDERRNLVASGMLALVENLAEHEDTRAAATAEPAQNAGEMRGPGSLAVPAELAPEWRGTPILCVGGRGNLDDAAAAMLTQLISRAGIGVRSSSFEDLEAARFQHLELDGVRMVCLSYLNVDSVAHARYMIRRIRRRLPDTPIMVGFWGLRPEEAARRKVPESTRADLFATSLTTAIEEISAAIRKEAPLRAALPTSTHEASVSAVEAASMLKPLPAVS